MHGVVADLLEPASGEVVCPFRDRCLRVGHGDPGRERPVDVDVLRSNPERSSGGDELAVPGGAELLLGKRLIPFSLRIVQVSPPRVESPPGSRVSRLRGLAGAVDVLVHDPGIASRDENDMHFASGEHVMGDDLTHEQGLVILVRRVEHDRAAGGRGNVVLGDVC
jgi:hypothetical protein